jgi:purine-nucleoside phosphorylase
VPEAIAAHALGAEVLAVSLVTNLAAGITGEPLSHEEVLARGRAAAPRCSDLLVGLLDRISSVAG